MEGGDQGLCPFFLIVLCGKDLTFDMKQKQSYKVCFPPFLILLAVRNEGLVNALDDYEGCMRNPWSMPT